MSLRFWQPAAFSIILLMSSCMDDGNSGSKPIIIGDPATIVTETDSAYLQDMVIEYQSVKQPEAEPLAAKRDTAKQAEPVKEEPTAVAETKKPEAPKEKGLTIDLKDVTILIPNVTAKGSGSSYQLKSGELNSNRIKITEGTVQKVSQRYQTVVVAETELGTLVLDNLSATSGWQPIKGGNGTYIITGLDEKKLAVPKATTASIRNAVAAETREKRMSKKMQDKWAASVKNVRSANQRPLSVELRSVMWKIDGKDAKGKSFSKQVRIDMPL